MQAEGGYDQFPVTNLVRDNAADDYSEAKPRKTRSVDESVFQGCEPELGSPNIQQAAADGKADTRCEDGHESGEQQPLCIWGDSYVTDFCVAHIFRGFGFGLYSKGRQFDNLSSTKGGLM